MLGPAAVPAKLLVGVVGNRDPRVLNIAPGQMETAHAAVIVALPLVVLAVLASVPHSWGYLVILLWNLMPYQSYSFTHSPIFR